MSGTASISQPRSLTRWQRGWALLWSCRAEVFKQCLLVILLASGVALLIWFSRGTVTVMSQLMYSLPMALVCWAVIDTGRFFIDQDSDRLFPRGWKALALCSTAIALGFVTGTSVGDWYSGWSTWELMGQAPDKFAFVVLFSVCISAAITMYFYQRGKESYLLAVLATRERQATQAQLKLLQSQLDPHMLFNTLANLRALIQTEPERAVRMLDQLNDFLRSTLSASRAELHSLQAEFERLGDYLALMQIRMGKRLAFTLDLPEDLKALQVPSLILQSLVENAVVHGLEPTVEGGSVRVAARRDGANLLLSVQDDGLGIDTATLREGFGISQVRERLAQLYGADQTQVTIKSIANYVINTAAGGDLASKSASDAEKGCLVELRLPAQAAQALEHAS
jgi:hypothetical protein